MPPKAIQRKFEKRGRKSAFARYAGVTLSAVVRWLKGDFKSRDLDRLSRTPVRDWKPAEAKSDTEQAA